MKKLLLLFLFLCSLEVAQAQPGISTAIPSEKPSKYQKDQIKRKYGMFIHFGINTFHDVEWSDGSFPVETYAPAEIDACQWVKTAKDAGMKYIILVAKPDQEIYEYFFRKFDLNPSECFFIDDLEKNIQGAKDAGMDGIIFTGDIQAVKDAIDF